MTLEMVVFAALGGACGGLLVVLLTSGIIPEIVRYGVRNDRGWSNGYVRTFPEPTTPRPAAPPAPLPPARTMTLRHERVIGREDMEDHWT